MNTSNGTQNQGNRGGPRRPALVSIFSVLLAFDAVLEGFQVIISIAQNYSGLVALIAISLMLVFVGILLFIAWGLWNLKNWARIGFIIVVIINFFISLPDLISAFPDNAAIIIGSIVLALLFRGAIVYWLATNGAYFKPGGNVPTGPISSEPAPTGRVIKIGMLVRLGFLALVIVSVIGALLIGGLNLQNYSSSPTDDPFILPTGSPTPVGFASIVQSFDVAGSELGVPSSLLSPDHLTVDAAGNIYMDTSNNLHIYKYDPTGKYIGGWDLTTSQCSGLIEAQDALATDQAGHVFVVCDGSILKYDGATGKYLAKFDGSKISPREYYTDLAVYRDGGLLVLANGVPTGDEVLLHLDPSGKVLARFPNLLNGIAQTGQADVTFLPAVDSMGNIYVLNR